MKYNPLAPFVTELEIPFSHYIDEEVYIKFDVRKDTPVGMRVNQRQKTRAFDPMTYLILNEDKKNIAAGMTNEQACFGVEEASTFMSILDLLSTEMQTFMPGSYMMRIKRKSGLQPKSQDITSMVMEGLFS